MMKDLGLAVMLKHPRAVHGRDYNIVDKGNGPEIQFWNLDEPPPATQADVDAILEAHEDERVEQEAKFDPEWPTIEERLKALEQGQTRKPDMDQAKQRARDRIARGRASPPQGGGAPA